MRILLTGGAGFIGSHVVASLAEKYPDYQVRGTCLRATDQTNRVSLFVSQIVVLDKLDYCSSKKNLEETLRTRSNVKFVKGDVRSIDLLQFILNSEKIDTILHFAAQTHVDNSFGNSCEFTANNIEGTHSLLEACRGVKRIKRFLHVSTDEVYGENSTGSNTEHSSLLTPTNPYAATKAGAEMLVLAYGRSYGLPYVITRGNNVYGPNQHPEKAVPKFSILAQRGDMIPIHGDGSATRSYMHVNDAAAAFDTILHRGETSQIYNIGGREERTVLSVAGDICKLHSRNPEESITYVDDRAFNDRRYYIDCTKLLSLGWSQKVAWEDGLKETINWYSNNDLQSYWGDFSASLAPHPSMYTSKSLQADEEADGSDADADA
jgi:dTDP-glucose 4,6-dehydratase